MPDNKPDLPSEAESKKTLEERVKKLEERLDNLLSGKVELEVQDVAVAARSKLRVSCE